MGDIEIHTADGWKRLGDIIIARIKCSKCGEEGEAESIGFQKCDPPELLIWFCRECR